MSTTEPFIMKMACVIPVAFIIDRAKLVSELE